MTERRLQVHPFEPVWDENSRVLILGSFPSVQSRKVQFYYGNPRNRFWKVLGALFDADVPGGTDARKEFLHAHHIALFDVLASCEIAASADSTISRAVPNDLHVLMENAPIQRVFTNGRAAARYYEQFFGSGACYLPSTSPANAAFSFERLVAAWRVILPYVSGENM